MRLRTTSSLNTIRIKHTKISCATLKEVLKLKLKAHKKVLKFRTLFSMDLLLSIKLYPPSQIPRDVDLGEIAPILHKNLNDNI